MLSFILYTLFFHDLIFHVFLHFQAMLSYVFNMFWTKHKK